MRVLKLSAIAVLVSLSFASFAQATPPPEHELSQHEIEVIQNAMRKSILENPEMKSEIEEYTKKTASNVSSLEIFVAMSRDARPNFHDVKATVDSTEKIRISSRGVGKSKHRSSDLTKRLEMMQREARNSKRGDFEGVTAIVTSTGEILAKSSYELADEAEREIVRNDRNYFIKKDANSSRVALLSSTAAQRLVEEIERIEGAK